MGDAVWDQRAPKRPGKPPQTNGGGSGGFAEAATSINVRAKFTRDQIAAFLPTRGAFTFPAPYGTRGIRVTNEEDGEIWPVGYSYWPNVNYHAQDPTLLVFAGHLDGSPRFFRVDKASGSVAPLGPLVPIRATGEGWYWSKRDAAKIYVATGNRLLRCDVVTGAQDVVMEIDPLTYVWQAHSSDDDASHSATARDFASGTPLASVATRGGSRFYYAAVGVLDECQIDGSGRYLVIKEDNDNRIIDLESGVERILRNAEGAAGHSDCGIGTLVGEDDYDPLPGAMKLWDLARLPQAVLQYHLTQWATGLGHVAVVGNVALISNAHREDHPRVNELVRVPLDGTLTCTIVAPNLVNLDEPGSDYDKLPKANLDPTGSYACWTANGHGHRDLFLVRMPS